MPDPIPHVTNLYGNREISSEEKEDREPTDVNMTETAYMRKLADRALESDKEDDEKQPESE